MQDQLKQWIAQEQEHLGKPYRPAGWTEDVAYAIRALYEGTANDGQQILAMQWIEYIAGVGDFENMSFHPGGLDGDRATAFAEGKRHVGLQIRKMRSPLITEAIQRERTKEAQSAHSQRGAR